MGGEKVFEARWVCPKCGAPNPRARRIAVTGAGLSRLLNWQHIEYVAVSCKRCGYTELYDAEVVGDERKAMGILDLILGG